MENIIGILLVITFIALIAYSGSQIQKQEEKLRIESFKHKQKRDKVKLIIKQKVSPIYKNCCEQVIYKHRFALLADRKKLLTKDSYGRIIDKGWQFIDYDRPSNLDKSPVTISFRDDFIQPEINKIDEIRQLFYKFPKEDEEEFDDIFLWASNCFSEINSMKFYQWIEDQINSVCDELENKNVKFGDSSSMDGVQYEQFCKRILEDSGWVVEDTPTSGDQGVDLIASIEDLRVCIQCKCFAKPVGNKAVQEVAAGMIHWNGTHAVVVGKSGFTKSAQSLAKSTKVILTSDSELENLENLVL